MKHTVALILCGGEGTRLRPLTFYFQKTMLPIGLNQKPLLEYIVRLLKYHRINDIVMLVGYKYKQIINYFEDGSRFGVHIYAMILSSLGRAGPFLMLLDKMPLIQKIHY